MNTLKINKKFNRKIDLITFQLKLLHYDLSENELKLLALLYLNGINYKTKEIALKQNIFKSMQSIENHISKFRRMNIIVDNVIKLTSPIVLQGPLNISIVCTLP